MAAADRPLRVLHLVGSPTDEFFAELSRLYAADCLDAVADATRYEPLVAHVGPGGVWSFPRDLGDASRAAAPSTDLPTALREIADFAPDVAVPQLFCRAGMTDYRALLDLVGVPFVGNRADTMALGAHKARCRAVVAGAGVDVPPGEVLRPGEAMSLTPPVVVKPVDADNSSGVSLVRDQSQLAAALEGAAAHSADVLVERYVELGREVRCGVLERPDGFLQVLPLEEYAVHPDRKPIRDAADKLARGEGDRLSLVAKDTEHAWLVDPSDPVNDAVAEAARTAHRALGCRHYSLFDFRIDPTGRPWFLEAGLYCSFARSSVVAVMAAAAGIPLQRLFADLLGASLTPTSLTRTSSSPAPAGPALGSNDHWTPTASSNGARSVSRTGNG